MASPPRERVKELFSLVQDWVRFKRYERSLKRAAGVEAEAPDGSAATSEPTAWHRVVGGLVIGSLILICLLVLFSCTASLDLSGGERRDPPVVGESSLPSDPDTLEPQPTEVPSPTMDLESAYKDGYFTDPETGARYLVAQIDKDAKAPSSWTCRPTMGRPTQLCVVGPGPASEEVPEPADEPAPEANSAPRSGGADVDGDAPAGAAARDTGDSTSTQSETSPDDNGKPVEWVAVGVAAAGVLVPVLIWQWPKRSERERFHVYRVEIHGAHDQHQARAGTATTVPGTKDSAPRRPSIGGGDLGPPV